MLTIERDGNNFRNFFSEITFKISETPLLFAIFVVNSMATPLAEGADFAYAKEDGMAKSLHRPRDFSRLQLLKLLFPIRSDERIIASLFVAMQLI